MNRSRSLSHFLFAFFLLISTQIAAQNITGNIKDAVTQQTVGFCNVLLANTPTGASSNASGNFKINVPLHVVTQQLIISAVGYTSDTVKISPDKTHYEIFLTQQLTNLNAVVVTGVTRATLIRQNPVAIVSVSPKAIEQTVASNIIDVLVKNVPGLNAVKTGPNISKPFIRGLGYNRVLTLYDGIRQEGQQWGDEHGIEVDAYNIDRAEVIKGPASMMYGSDAVAGVVSMVPVMPSKYDDKLHGKYLSEYQSNNGLFGNGIRLPYTKNNWGYALRGSYRIAKNYTNAIDGRVYNTGFRESNASATVQHTSKNGFSNLNATLYDNLQGIPDGSRDSLSRKFTKQIYEGAEDDLKNRPLVSDAALNSYQLSPLHQHIQHYRIYSNNHYSLGQGDIDISLAFQQNIRREFSHPTDPDQPGMFVRLNTFTYGFRYNAPTFLNTDISVGLNGMYQNNKTKSATNFPIPDYNLFDVGGYIFVKWKYNRWTASAGLRYDTRHLHGDNFYTINDPLTGFSKEVSSDITNARLQFPAISKNFTGTSLSLGTTYQVSSNIGLKANIAKGYRAPSITEFASNGLDPGAHIIYLGNRSFIPEFSLQEDIGIDLNYKDISASASIFNNNIDNYIYLTQLTDGAGNPIVDAQGNKTFQYQQAKAQLYGTELTFDLHPSSLKGFSFTNSFSTVYGFNRKKAYKNEGLEGEYLPLIPPAKLLSSIVRAIPTKSKLFQNVNVKIEAENYGAQNRYLGLENTETPTAGYTLVNISFNTSMRVFKENPIAFQVEANNLLNKAYQSNLSRLKYFEYYNQSPNGHLGIYNMGRNISVKAIVSF
jgi:iron complex outermembrane receptor protein